jgi:hypothetical protein
MISLHDHLSEFSYGYGVTRETERLLASFGIVATPFQPNLVQEAQVGFDVAFHAPGLLLMLQFKLGQELRVFRRSHPSQPKPLLDRPFWRFGIDMDGHQFRRLLASEQGGAQVYYAAPRFSNWLRFNRHYQAGAILHHSLIAKPSDLAAAAGGASGKHRVLYDQTRRHILSDPHPFPEVLPEKLAFEVSEAARGSKLSLVDRLERLDANFREFAPRMIFEARASADFDGTPEWRLAARVGLQAFAVGAQLFFVHPIVPDFVPA